MNAKVLLCCLAATLSTATLAHAQVGSFTLDWQVNGVNSVNVNPGDTVVVTGIASWTPAAWGLGNTQFRVNLNGADASDALDYNESMGRGRAPLLRLLPQVLTDNTVGGGRTITGAMNTVIDCAQLPQMINPLFTNANPIEIFRFNVVAGDAGHTIDIGSEITNVTIMSNFQGLPTAPYTPSVDGAQINIVPTPGSFALIGVGGAACIRRRRRSN